MKIAMIGHKRVPSRSGGVEVVVGKLSELLVDMGFCVDIYNRYTGGEKAVEYNGARVFEIPTPKSSKLNAMVYSYLAVLKACFSDCDVIHFHAEGPCAAMPAAKLFKKRCVATIHGLDWQRSKWGGFASRYIKFGEKTAARYADEVIVLSRRVQRYFYDTYKRKTHFIPNGIEVKPYAPADIIKREYGLLKDSYILFAARITPEKGLDYLLDAFMRTDTDMKLVIAGAVEPSNEYIKSVVEKASADERIIFTGFAGGQKLSELFSNCFLYVLPSDIEGMPLSLLEAIGARARCIVSDIPENAEVAPEYLHTFKRGDADDLKEKLEYMISNSDISASNFGKNGSAAETDEIIDKIIAMYDWERIACETARLYGAAADDQKSPV